jgi:putative transposase
VIERAERAVDEAVRELKPLIGTKQACQAVGRPRANHYRRHRRSPKPPQPAREPAPQPRALSPAERDTVRALLNSEQHVDKAPAAVYHELLDEGVYVASISTMYRILREHGEVRERRRQAVHPPRVKPELIAEAPNRVWSWDITRLHGPTKWTYYYLYVILDIYSRYVVGWMLAERESAALAEQLLADTITKQNIDRGRLSIHADNGSSMASKPVAFLLADLGVTKSHSRPHTSNDPYSEAAFKTLKYRPEFPTSSGPSHTPARSAAASSPGTTPSTTTAASPGTTPSTSTTDTPKRSRPPAPTYWPPPTSATRNDSSASPPNHAPCLRPRGSTNHPTKTN